MHTTVVAVAACHHTAVAVHIAVVRVVVVPCSPFACPLDFAVEIARIAAVVVAVAV